MKNRTLSAASGLVLLAALALGGSAAAQDTVGQVEQTLHDDAVAAYEAVSSFAGDMEGTVSDTASSTFETAQGDLAAIESRLAGAVDMVGQGATREYREIQHALDGITSDADGFLHQAGHTIEGVEHDTWTALQDGLNDVSNSIDHVIDGLPF